MYERFTADEIAIIRRLYPTGGSAAVTAVLTDRSPLSIRVAATRRGIRGPNPRYRGPIATALPGASDIIAREYPRLGLVATAAMIGASERDVESVARRLRLRLLPSAPRKPSVPLVRWDSATISRVIEMRSRDPRPSDDEIATALGCTLSALQTALSRHGITRQRSVDLTPVRAPKMRPCICCRNNFNSTGVANRMCPRCRSAAREAA
jgi:hypothetical protein